MIDPQNDILMKVMHKQTMDAHSLGQSLAERLESRIEHLESENAQLRDQITKCEGRLRWLMGLD